VLLLIGRLIDLTPAVIMMVPILLPIADRLDLDPIHLGIIVVVTRPSAGSPLRSARPCSSAAGSPASR